MIAAFNIIFILIGLAFLLPILVAAVAFLFKLSVGSIFVGFAFMVKSYEILTKKWWAWLIQLPILAVQFLLFYFEGWSAFVWICLLQMITSGIIFNIQRIIQKDY